MAGVELATAYVALVPSAKGIAAGIASEMGGPLESASREAGEKSSKSFGGAFTTGVAAAAKVAALGIGVAIAGFAGLEKIGSAFDDASDQIRTTTGATGDALSGLNTSFKNVVGTVPVDFDQASTAIAGLNQKLGLTGKPLETLSTQVLNLSRITGTDLSANVTATADLFNSWGTTAADQGPKLDELFRISQATGISVTDLATGMTQGGVQFRAAGLDFESTGALLGLLAKNGLDAGDVMPALSKAMAQAAKDGKPANEVFRDTFDAIRNAPDDTAAAGIALEVFGAKAGPKFAALIREGKLSYEDLATAIGNGGDTIGAAAADTDDWREKLKLLMNKGMLALEPIATKVFGALGKAMDAIPGILKAIKEGWDFFVGGLTGEATNEGSGVLLFLNHLGMGLGVIVDWVKAHWPEIKAVITTVFDAIKTALSYFVDVIVPMVIDGFKATFGWLMDNKEFLIGIAVGIGAVLATMFGIWLAGALAAAAATIAAAAPFIAIGLAVAGVVGGVIYAYNHFETFRRVVQTVARFFRDVVWPTMKWVFAQIVAAVTAAVDWVRDHWDQIKAVFEAVGRFLSNVVWPVMKAVFTGIVTAVGSTVKFVIDHWDQISGVFEATGRFLSEKVWPVIKRVFDDIAGAVMWLVDLISDHWGRIQSETEHVFNAVRDVITVAFTVIRTVIETAITVITGLWDTFGGPVLAALQTAWDLIVGVFTAAWDLIKGIVQGAIDTVKGIIETVVSLITGDWSGAWDGIKQIVFGIWEQIKAIVQAAIDAVKLAIRLVWATIKLEVQIAWDGIKLIISTVWDVIKSVISGAIDAVVGYVTALPGRIGGVFLTLWDGLKTGITIAKDWVHDRIEDVFNFAKGLPGRMAGVFVGMWDGIKNAFRSAINAVIGWWNGLDFKFPGFDIPGPGPNIPGFTLGLPDIPKLHTGGMVPGTVGADVPIVARAGELVLTGAQQAQLFAMANGALNNTLPTINITNNRRDIGVADLNQILAMARLS